MSRSRTDNTSPIQFLMLGDEEYALIPLRLLEMVESLEDLEDELLAARARMEADGESSRIPAAVVHAIVRGVHPVRAWREFRGLTQEELAGRVGTSKAYISHIERGLRQPALPLARALADALDVSLDVLADEITEFMSASTDGAAPTAPIPLCGEET